MPKSFPTAPDCFTATPGKKPVRVIALATGKDFESWLKKSVAPVRQRVEQSGFTAKPGSVLPIHDDHGHLSFILAGVNDPLQIFDLSAVCDHLAKSFADKALATLAFKLEGVKPAETNTACLGWGLAAYRFERYKTANKKPSVAPKLVWPDKADRKSVLAHLEAATLIRDLINIPANDMGPDELEKAARAFATTEKLTVKVIKDKDLLKQNFPMIYAVGQGSPRRPRLIDLQWGNPKHKKLTLVGKGVCFDTGGLDIKPGAAMYTMKKDMGGAAHVLGLALLIIRHKLPVNLRILIPAVENSTSGEAFRPSDVIPSRKGLTVEIGNTDAEGRLVVADAITLACEDNPDLLIDFATLTGAARVATGMDIPPIFSNNEALAMTLKDISMAHHDPLWPLPLWQPYRKDLASDIADLNNVGGKAGAITAALFIESFVAPKTDWVHIDLSAWNESARPGRPKGGMEMGLRTVFAFLQQRFGT